MASRRPGSLIDAFESPCDCFDFFLPNLRTLTVSQEGSGVTGEISDLVIEVFCPPFWHQVLFELPANFVSHFRHRDALDAYSSLCKFHCWKKGVDRVLQEALRLYR